MKKAMKMPKKMIGKLSPAMASKIRIKAQQLMASDRVKPDPDSAAGAAT